MKQNTFRQSRTPLYLQLAETLRQSLEKGCWREGELLPTIPELVKEFGVAKITVRQAIKLLEQDKLVEPKRGRGTVVLSRPPRLRRLKVETRLSDLIEMYRGDKPEMVLLDDKVSELPYDVDYGVGCGGYHMLRRTHVREGQCYCVLSIYIAEDVFRKHEHRLRQELVLPVLFETEDIDIKMARQTLQVRKCDVDAAGLLGLLVGDPVADVRRILCNGEGEIVYLADVVYRGDYIRLDMDLLA